MFPLSTPVRTAAHPDPRPLVLHVTEAMGGGLEDAVNDFIRSAPHYRHALLFTRRGPYATAERRPDLVEVVDAGRGVRALRRAYGPTVRRLQPDVIHLHSAWAGLVGRLNTSGPRRARIVYSPHSYYFDRRDLALPVLRAARALERLLSARTAVTAAVSPFEASTARDLGSAAEYIPNIVRLPEDLRWCGGSGRREVVLVGRVTAQKAPEFLLAMLPHLRSDIRFTWVGSGDPAAEARLRAAGVHVTGWMPRADSLVTMARADAYLHTAAWEGSPITLLEAAAIGVPIVARSIPALDSLGFAPMLRRPAAAAAALERLLDGGAAPVAPSAPSPAMQGDAIERMYARVLGRTGPVRIVGGASLHAPVLAAHSEDRRDATEPGFVRTGAGMLSARSR